MRRFIKDVRETLVLISIDILIWVVLDARRIMPFPDPGVLILLVAVTFVLVSRLNKGKDEHHG